MHSFSNLRDEISKMSDELRRNVAQMGINPDDLDKFHAEIRRPIDELNSVRQQILADFKARSRIWDEIERGPAVPEPSTSMMIMIMMQRMIDNTPWRHPAHNRFHL